MTDIPQTSYQSSSFYYLLHTLFLSLAHSFSDLTCWDNQLATLLAAAASLAGVEATPTHKHGSCGHKKFWWPVKQTCLPYGGVKHPHPAPPATTAVGGFTGTRSSGAAFHLNPRSSMQSALPLGHGTNMKRPAFLHPWHAACLLVGHNSSAFPSTNLLVASNGWLCPYDWYWRDGYCAPREPAYGAPVCAEKYTWDGAVFYCKRGY
ncbi:hypothetical protein RHS01_05498 [Rhizoctonia solani]|uniref:Uncharacterized protein n=1 Tax=Rhizoctonia solani TaxID=456999 RepID=A0A8H7M1L7_9AGAM|nr:hypothetical protein RHS01_05498 [Rhizoctonia solani]